MSGHTPGPWACDVTEYGSFCPVRSKLGQVICDTAFLGGSQRVANSKLIAAAPDLLGELENCLDLLIACFSDSPVDSCMGVAITKARAAIAKATGEAT